MANARAIAEHVAPRIAPAAEAVGSPDAADRASGSRWRSTTTSTKPSPSRPRASRVYGSLPNYQRILAHGGVDAPADAAIVGDEAAVTAQIEALFEAGGTDFWAAPFPVGGDRAASRARTRALLRQLGRRLTGVCPCCLCCGSSLRCRV